MCALLSLFVLVAGLGGAGAQAGALFAGLLMVDSPFAKKAHACMQPLTSLFGGMYLGSLGMIVNPVRESFRHIDDTPQTCPVFGHSHTLPGVVLFSMARARQKSTAVDARNRRKWSRFYPQACDPHEDRCLFRTHAGIGRTRDGCDYVCLRLRLRVC